MADVEGEPPPTEPPNAEEPPQKAESATVEAPAAPEEEATAPSDALEDAASPKPEEVPPEAPAEEVPMEGVDEKPQEGDVTEGAGDAVAPDEKPEESAEVDGGGGEEPVLAAEEGEAPQTEQPEEIQEEAENAETPLPQSEDFTKGDIPEVALEVTGDVLSREATPPPPSSDELTDLDMVEPGTPPRESGDSGNILEEEEEEEVVPRFNREELIEKYHAALQEREMLNQKNYALQHKLAEYFKRKKTEDSRQEVDRNVTDQEQRYLKYMSNLEELHQQEAAERESYNELIEEMKERKTAKQALVEHEWGQYSDFKKSIALASVNSRTGRTLTQKEFEIYELNEVKKEAEVSQVRLENIKLRNRLRKREHQLKQKEELAEGLHLIDFEQLKIENQTYNEKIEERNEELMKLRKKITSTVQVLTHLKEKLQFVQAENHVAKQELGHVEADVAAKRDVLSRTKQARDALRNDNGKLQQKCGLLGNHLLLRDYEESTDENDDLSHRLDQLKRTHAELTLSINGVKKKIEQARAQAQS